MASPVADRPVSGTPRTASGPDSGRRPAHPLTARLGGFALVGLQLALVLAVVRLYDVAERNHFFAVACLAVGGFLVHAWLPLRFRLPFFGLLSLAGIVFVLGWPDG